VLRRVQWGSLRTKIIVWSFVPTAMILLAVALVNFHAYQQVTGELVVQRDQELTRLSASQLATELEDYADLLTTLARTSDIYRSDPAAQRDALKRASRRLAVFDAGALILDTFGTVVATEPERPDILGQDWSDHTYYLEILRAQIRGLPGPVFSDIVADGPGGAEVVVVAVPIIGEQGELLGTMAGMFRLGATAMSAFYGDIVRLRFGESGSIYLVDGNGRAIYHAHAGHIGEDFTAQTVVQQALNGQVGAVRTRDLEGQDIVAGFAPVPGTRWGLVTEERWTVLTSRSRTYQRFLLLLLGIGVVVPTLVATVAVRWITEPIAQLIGAAQEVARGNFGQTITARTGDEVEELAEQFNRMSAQLQESYAHLEQRVADRTRELRALNAIATVVSRSLDLEEVLNSALDKTLEVTGIEGGGIYLLQEDGQVLTTVAHKGLGAQFVAEIDDLSAGEGFSGRVIQTGEPVVVRDLSTDPRLTRLVVRERGFRSAAVFPLVSRGKVLGSLFVITRDYREFPQQDLELLTSIGGQIGVAVENARLFTQVEQRMRELEALYRADAELYRHLDLDKVLQTLVDVAVDVLQADKSSLMVWDARRERLVVGAAHGFSPGTMAQMSFAPGEGIVGRVAASGAPMIVEDARTNPRVATRVTEPEEIRSFMHVPIKIGGQVFGVFNVDYLEPRAFGDEERRLFTALARRAALVIENAQLYERAQELAVVEERNRLARDLHDAVTQTLFSASLIADVLPRIWERDPDAGRARLEEVRQLTRGALAEMRTLLLELRPAALAEADLGELLRQLAEATIGRARVPVTVQVTGECPVPPDVKVALYRIAQEALNNVAKHAGASQATVSLRCTPPSSPSSEGGQTGRVELRISDDGRGFDAGAVSPRSLGLGIMRERVEAIGAGLTVESAIGHGTEVTVVWPRDS
jgi:nitrate/nitrite-specific signal transduction histidine kinase